MRECVRACLALCSGKSTLFGLNSFGATVFALKFCQLRIFAMKMLARSSTTIMKSELCVCQQRRPSTAWTVDDAKNVHCSASLVTLNSWLMAAFYAHMQCCDNGIISGGASIIFLLRASGRVLGFDCFGCLGLVSLLMTNFWWCNDEEAIWNWLGKREREKRGRKEEAEYVEGRKEDCHRARRENWLE